VRFPIRAEPRGVSSGATMRSIRMLAAVLLLVATACSAPAPAAATLQNPGLRGPMPLGGPSAQVR